MSKKIATLLGAIFCFYSTACSADVISPQIKEDGSLYSEATPDASMFGSGPGSEHAEASMLRFEGGRKLRERKYDEAISKFSQAVQFDPEDPESHILLARALTAKIMRSKNLPDSKLLKEAIDEWKLLWHHDADQSEQIEAKNQARMLSRLAKSIAKDKTHSLATRGEVLTKKPKDEFGM